MFKSGALVALVLGLTVAAGCGTLNTSQFDTPERQASLALTIPSSSVPVTTASVAVGQALPTSGKWYFDSATGKWYFDSATGKWYCDQD